MDAKTEPGDHLLAAVQELCTDRLTSELAGPLTEFAAHVMKDLPPDDAVGRDPRQSYGALLSLWKLAGQRKLGGHAVRVYNPRLDEHGWSSPHTVIETAAPNMPFIVDSVVAALNGFNGQIFQLLHPVVPMLRDKDGKLTGCGGDEDERESLIQIEFSTHTDSDDLAAMQSAISTAIADVTLAVNGWRPILDRAAGIIADLTENPPPLPKEEVEEAQALLKWMVEDHFTFLGYREYDYLASQDSERLEIVEGSGLGLLSDPARRVMERASGEPALSPEVREFLQRPELIIVTKANKRSTIHRPVHLDYIGVKKFNDAGQIVGERRFIGLFTSAAYNRTPREIPYLRRKAAKILSRSGFDLRGHAGKALVNVLDTFPRDELFQIGEDDLYNTAMGIFGLLDRPRIKLFLRRDRFERFFSCLVFVPRERYDSELRRKFEKILAETLGGRISAFYTQIGDLSLARLHVIVGGSPTARDVDVGDLETRLIGAARSWSDGLREALEGAFGEEKAGALLRLYGDAFSAAYRENFPPAMASIDIGHIETAGGQAPGLNLYRRLEDTEDELRLKLFRKGEALALSDVLPMLENMGLRVLSEQTYPVGDPVEPLCWLHDFLMQSVDGRSLNLAEVKPAFEDGFLRIFAGMMEDDGFNGLIVGAGLEPQEVILLRAYCKYLRQAGIGFSQDYMEDTLARNGQITSLILELFFSLLDPAKAGGEPEVADTIIESVHVLLDEVASLDEDRILRRYLNAVQSTLRTNFFQNRKDPDGYPYISIKLDSQALDDLPLPRPHKEIFVYSPRFEGVHLRGGPVARGGLRWSDRREDFRTEVLGLVKAQMVKNAVIVPVGSKGGFVPKHLPPPSDREAFMAEGIACYRTFISGLLDITDNIGPDGVIPPADTMRRDDDDPYLVVAADKGTATFSDFANEVAISYGFWLGDAFASGGAAGYDHKGMGITARGAWECVKRHFREMGTDIQTEPFTVVGVGDMSGDVFGNGMLLSEQIKLVGAFDHRHIFLDPDPDPASTFAERRRIFDLGRSSWADYDQSLLSQGGMIIDRSAKKVKLTAEAATALGVEAGEMTPQQVLQAVILAPADLLWFGGIGTYVKAESESNADAGDRANDVIRINGSDLRVKVVGEGANLGVTQLGRVEFAQSGGRINTDFVDNSAGVDCSDHEVNLKILLGAVEASGDMTRKQRDTLLAEMTDEVAALVLRDNYLQGQAISVVEATGTDGTGPLQRLMRSFGQEGMLNRRVEFLPSDEEIADRTGGLTRPEISVLLSYAKMSLKTELMSGSLPDDPGQEAALLGYFPEVLQDRFAKQITGHRLRREIIATIAANFIVNRCGPTFSRLAQDELGVDASDIGRVSLAVGEIFDLQPVWDGIDMLDNQVDAAVQTRMITVVQQLMARAALWFLRDAAGGPIDRIALIERFRPAIASMTESLDSQLGDTVRNASQQISGSLVEAGVDAALADRIAGLNPLASALDVVKAAESSGIDVAIASATYFAIGSRLGLDWLRTQAAALPAENTWERQAVQMLVEDSYAQQRQLVVQAFAGGAASAEDALSGLGGDNSRELARAEQIMADIRTAGAVDLGRLVLANRQVGRLIAG
jgi:glutamate dehydrogenase